MPYIKLIELKEIGSRISLDISSSILSSQKSLALAPDSSISLKPGNYIIYTISI
jgi:hypothetical protein